MPGVLTTFMPKSAARDSFPAGGHQPIKGAGDNTRAIAREAKAMTFQSFVRSDQERAAQGNSADLGEVSEDSAVPKEATSEDVSDSLPASDDGEAHVEMAGFGQKIVDSDLTVGAAETEDFQGLTEIRKSKGATTGGQAAQKAEPGVSSRTTDAPADLTPANATVANNLQTVESLGQIVPSEESVAPTAVAMPPNPAADGWRATLGPGVDGLLRIDLPTGVTEARAPPPGAASEPHIMRHVAAQMLEAMIRSSERSIDVFLNPVELGRLRLTLVQGEAGMIVNVTAERAETLELMRRYSDSLGQEFQDLGYGGTDFTFTRDGQAGGWGPMPDDALSSATPQPELQPVSVISLRVDNTDRLDIRL